MPNLFWHQRFEEIERTQKEDVNNNVQRNKYRRKAAVGGSTASFALQQSLSSNEDTFVATYGARSVNKVTWSLVCSDVVALLSRDPPPSCAMFLVMQLL